MTLWHHCHTSHLPITSFPGIYHLPGVYSDTKTEEPYSKRMIGLGPKACKFTQLLQYGFVPSLKPRLSTNRGINLCQGFLSLSLLPVEPTSARTTTASTQPSSKVFTHSINPRPSVAVLWGIGLGLLAPQPYLAACVTCGRWTSIHTSARSNRPCHLAFEWPSRLLAIKA